MANWQLSEIQDKVRRVTGRLTSREISDLELNNYINQFYQYTFPADVKLERMHTFYEFNTLANHRFQTLPSGYVNFEPPATMDYQEIDWYQDPYVFEDQNPYTYNKYVLGTGDGSTSAFSDTITDIPILPGSVNVADDTEIFTASTDTWTSSTVTLTGSKGGSGSVNYETGAVSVTFNTAPADGVNVVFSYVTFVAGRPTAVLLYNNRFEFYPPPDQTYAFRCKAYANNLVLQNDGTVAVAFENTTDTPLYDEWGPAIAYGTSRNINSDYGEMDAYAENTALYKEQLAYILRRTHQNLLNTRSEPHF
jgi:hypothetical protein